jgi:hypothetical protein
MQCTKDYTPFSRTVSLPTKTTIIPRKPLSTSGRGGYNSTMKAADIANSVVEIVDSNGSPTNANSKEPIQFPIAKKTDRKFKDRGYILQGISDRSEESVYKV